MGWVELRVCSVIKAIVNVREPVQQSDDQSMGQVEFTSVGKSMSRAGKYIHSYSTSAMISALSS